MGIFDFFKKKPIEKKSAIANNYILPFFGQIPANNLEEYYSVSFEFDDNIIKADLNFENKIIEKKELYKIESFLNDIKCFEKNNRIYIENDFKLEKGEALDYINFYFDELYESELEEIIDFKNQDIPTDIQLLEKLKLIRVGIYPDGKDETNYFATFDYSIYINKVPCNQLLVINTDEKGNLVSLTWES